MIKNIFVFNLLLIVFLFPKENNFAQTDNSIEIDGLKAPNSPAFVLLGITPTSIERPETPKKLGVSILNNFQSTDLLPRNYALEVSPYWLFSHTDLTFDNYYNPGFAQCLLQNFSISIGTAPLDSLSKNTSLAIGFRTLLMCGKPDNKLNLDKNRIDTNEYIRTIYLDPEKLTVISIIKRSIDSGAINNFKNLKDKLHSLILSRLNNNKVLSRISIEDKTQYLNNLENNIIKVVKAEIQKYYMDSDTLTKEELITIVDSTKNILNDQTDQKLHTLLKKVREDEKKRQGFLLEIGGGITSNFKNDSVKNGKFGKAGLWLTPMWSSNTIDFLGVARLLTGFYDGSDTTNLDYGARLLLKIKDFDFSAEGLVRVKSHTLPIFRYSVELDYKIASDIYLTGTIGRDFSGNPISGNGNLISLMGLNIGIGSNPMVKMK